MIKRYRKKPVVIEAVQWTGDNLEDVQKLDPAIVRTTKLSDTVMISTLEGTMIARPGYWIIRGVAGEIYPCDPEIFDQTYEEE